MQEKDFDKWNDKKKYIQVRDNVPFFRERDIWWCSLGLNVGFEQDGHGDEYRRPILVLKGLSRDTCLVIPLTTGAKEHPLRPSIGLVNGKEARAILSQIKVIDRKRLVSKIGYLDQVMFEKIRNAVKDLL